MGENEERESLRSRLIEERDGSKAGGAPASGSKGAGGQGNLRPVPPPENIEDKGSEEERPGFEVVEVEGEGEESSGGEEEAALEVEEAGGEGARPPEAGGAPERRATGLLNRRALTNGRGLVNGNGLVNGGRNGLVNGGRRGAINGTGLVNGGRNGLINGGRRGVINGRGITNGRGVTNGRELGPVEVPPKRPARKGPVAALAVVIVLVLVTVSYYALLSTEKGIRIDGDFSDWSGALKYPDDSGDEPNADVNIRHCSLVVDDTTASFHLRVEGRALAGRGGGVDSFYIFLDTDRSPATGYPVQSVGAEYVLVVDGYEGRVSACGLCRFGGAGRAQGDWNSRTAVGSARAAASGGELEAQVSLQDVGLRAGGGLNMQIVGRSSKGGEDIGPVVGTERAALKVVWARAGPATVSPGESGVSLLKIELTALGGSVRVSSLRVSVNEGTGAEELSRVSLKTAGGAELPGASGSVAGGSVLLAPASPVELKRGATMALTVSAGIPLEAMRGRSVGLSIADARALTTSTSAVTVEGRGGNLTLIGAPSQKIIIDGCFQDWDGYPAHPDPAGDVANPSVDLTDFRVANDTASIFICAAVSGEMMGGALVPEAKQRPVAGPGGGGGPVSLPALTGEDAFLLFIDVDGRSDTGYCAGGVPIGAEYLARVSGRDGRITSRALMPFTGGADRGSWSWGNGTDFPAAVAGGKMEAGISLSALGRPNGTIGLFYYTTDWSSRRDDGSEIKYNLKEAGGGRGLQTGDPAGAETGAEPARAPGEQPLHAPEFGELLLPLAGVAGAFALFRRLRWRRFPRGPASEGTGGGRAAAGSGREGRV